MPHALTWRDLLVLLVLTAALGATAHHLASTLAPRNAANALTFVRAPSSTEAYLRLRQEWRPRIGSAAAARLVSEFHGGHVRRRGFERTVAGTHTAAWLVLANLSLIAGFGRRALLLMWGVFAAVVFGYAPGLVSRIYPWDLPALVAFTVFVVLVHHGRWRWLPAVILAGLLFKETTAVLCLAPLFRDAPWRRRLREAGLLLAAVAAVKVGVDLLVGNPVPLLSPTVRPPEGGGLRLGDNLAALLRPSAGHPLWLNAGTLVALFLVPARDRTVAMLKTVAAVFAVALFVFGEIREYRIWFEAAPLAVYGIARGMVWPAVGPDSG